MTCPQCLGIEKEFNRKAAARDLRTYRKRGPKRSTRLLIEALTAGGVAGRTALDIGGGVGAIQHALFEAGVAHITGVDASAAYLQAATEEVARQGHADRVHYHHGDFIDLAPDVEPVDIVTLDRVLCCYPDMQALVGLSVARARHLYGVVYPRDTWWARLLFTFINGIMRLRRTPFRTFLHAPEAVDALIHTQGMRQQSFETTLLWQVVVYSRSAR